MRLLKPAWVSHEGKPIFSIDIHPDDSRFATGGQGNNSGLVAIWSMAPVRDEISEKDENIPKLICQMDNHLACVNCVRWSIDGRYLASSGDDKLIMIWQFSRNGGMSAAFGSSNAMASTETWRAVHILRGHTGDVLDLAWSPDKSYLASCSIDNTIIIWNALKFPEQTAVLRGHTGLVKGITWDPVGKYLASQSDDRTIRIWSTFSWQTETVVSKPFAEPVPAQIEPKKSFCYNFVCLARNTFELSLDIQIKLFRNFKKSRSGDKKCGGTTHVLRLNWSPDGQYIVSAHAMNNSGPTAQIIERDGWQTKMDFVGHRKAITVVRFNQRIFSKKFQKNPNQLIEYTCCAVGSRDRSVSVWLTSLKRPLVVINDLFENSVLDISWSSNGTELMCCSWDGTVAYFDFDHSEIGKPMTTEEKSNLHRKLYGDSVLMPKNSPANRIIESTEVLKLQKQQSEMRQQQKQLEEKTRREQQAARELQHTMSSSHDSNSPNSQSKQIETRTKDGRRRITPIFLAPQPTVGDVPLPFSSGGASVLPVFSSSKETSSIVVEKKNEITSPVRITKENSRSMHLYDMSDARSSKTSELANTTSGKLTDLPTSGESLQSANDAGKTARTELSNNPSIAIDKPSQEISDRVERLLVENSGYKSKHGTPDEPPKKKDGRGRPRKDRTLESSKLYASPGTSLALVTASPQHGDIQLVQSVVGDSSLRLPTPVIEGKKTISCYRRLWFISRDRQLDFGFHPFELSSASDSNGDSQSTLQVENNVRSNGIITLHRIRCSNCEGRLSWEAFVSSKLSIVSGNSSLVAAACEDRSLHLYSSTTGRRLCPSIVLDSPPSYLCCAALYVMVITSRAATYVWNIRTLLCVVNNASLDSVLSGGQYTIERCRLTDQGIPVVCINNNQSYIYHVDLRSWLTVSSPDNPLYICSDYQTSSTRSSSVCNGILTELQSTARQRSNVQGMQMLRTDASIQRSSTLSHLENQVACSLALKSGKEFHFWLNSYVRYLVQEGMEDKLREVCDDLLGPSHGGSSGKVVTSLSRWDPAVLGYRKRTLLREILPIVGANVGLQRLFAEYQQQLTSTEN